MKTWLKKWCRDLGKIQSKLIRTVMSCGGHLAHVDLTLCTLKIQHDVQLVMAKFCWSIKDCQSQASFNDSTTKGLGPKILACRVLVGGGEDLVSPITTLSPSIKASSRPTKMSRKQQENNSLPIMTLSLHQGLAPPQKFPEHKRDNNSLCF